MWGVLPIALKGVLTTLDPMTTTFFRYFIAAVLITPFLLIREKLVNRHKFRSVKLNLQLLLAGLLLVCNYALYIFGLERTTPEAAQLMMQVAPVMLLLAGVVVFKERFSVLQWLGFVIFVSGLLMFFSPRFADIFVSLSDYGIGLLMLATAATTWVGYAIIQKFLIKEFNPEETMLVFYWIGAMASSLFLASIHFLNSQLFNGLYWPSAGLIHSWPTVVSQRPWPTLKPLESVQSLPSHP